MSKTKFKSWSTSFSARVLTLITILWASFMTFAAVMIAYLAIKTDALVEINTLIIEVNKTFVAAVVSILITRVVGNVFEHNNGSIFGKSIGKEIEHDNTDSSLSTGDMCNNDESDNGSCEESISG